MEMIIMGFIYKITNLLNNKVYIGKTQLTLELRWQDHKKNFKKLQDDMAIHKAMFKYGEDNFSTEIIEECSDEIINDREKHWIEFYNSYQNGYNSTLGGEGALKWKPKQFYELWERGETLNEIAQHFKIDRHTVAKGLKIMGVTELEIKTRSLGKPVLQYSLDGKYIKRYDSLSSAAREFGSNNVSNIKSCCQGRIKSAYNFLWKYEADNTAIEQKVLDFKKSGKGKTKKVEQYDLNDNLIAVYNSCREAARAINAPYHIGINSCCLNKQKTAYGYKWKYREE